MDTLNQIETALQEAISEDLTYLKTVSGSDGNFEVALEELLKKAPAVFIVLQTFGRQSPIESFSDDAFQYTFNLIILARSMRGSNVARKDLNTGAYKIIDDLIVALQGKRLGTGFSPIEFTKGEYVLSSQIGVIYRTSITFHQFL